MSSGGPVSLFWTPPQKLRIICHRSREEWMPESLEAGWFKTEGGSVFDFFLLTNTTRADMICANACNGGSRHGSDSPAAQSPAARSICSSQGENWAHYCDTAGQRHAAYTSYTPSQPTANASHSVGGADECGAQPASSTSVWLGGAAPGSAVAQRGAAAARRDADQTSPYAERSESGSITAGHGGSRPGRVDGPAGPCLRSPFWPPRPGPLVPCKAAAAAAAAAAGGGVGGRGVGEPPPRRQRTRRLVR